MRDFILFLLCFLSFSSYGVESQFCSHFQQRFGPNSPLYNEPLYFNRRKRKKAKQTVHIGTHRERIKKELERRAQRKALLAKQ